MYKFAILLLGGALLIGALGWYSATPAIAPIDDPEVLIIGAGAAGLTAGFELAQHGIRYTILEASGTYGGRMKETTDLANFPIDLGAEWIHEDPIVLNEMAGQPVSNEIDIVTYNPRELLIYTGESLEDHSTELADYSEWKFKDTTWFSFFTTYLLPRVADQIRYNQVVTAIDYTDKRVQVSTESGDVYSADYVIVTVPISVLQREYITFTPPLPEKKVTAINNITMAPGLKAFIEFSEPFYPEMLYLEETDPKRPYEEKIFYDATFGKETDAHVMGILINGEYATPYVDLTDEAIITQLLTELDTAFAGTASQTYVQHQIENWSQSPFIQGTYTTDTTGPYRQTLRNAQAPLADRVFFAGAAYDHDMQGTVPGAARSARGVVDTLAR